MCCSESGLVDGKKLDGIHLKRKVDVNGNKNN